jgi:hypothetical protein
MNMSATTISGLLQALTRPATTARAAAPRPSSAAFQNVLQATAAAGSSTPPPVGGTPAMWGWSPEAQQHQADAQGVLPYHGAAHLNTFQVYYLAHSNPALLNLYLMQDTAERAAQGGPAHFAARDFLPATWTGSGAAGAAGGTGLS